MKSLDKLPIPPNAPDAESAVIGVIIGYPTGYSRVATLLTSDMFYSMPYQVIFEAAHELFKENKAIDIISLNEHIGKAGKSDIAPAYILAQCMGGVVSDAHLIFHAAVVREKYVAREFIKTAQTILSQIYGNTEDIDDVIHSANKRGIELTEMLIGGSPGMHMEELVRKWANDLKTKVERLHSGNTSGVNTGLTPLDKVTAGWQGSELVIVAARPAMGKTAVALHFAKSAALSGVPVAFFSLEMNDIRLLDRLMLSEAEINPESLKRGDFSPAEESRLSVATSIIQRLPIYIDDESDTSITAIRSKCRLLHAKGKCGLIIIDYLQLARESGANNRNREQEVSRMSRECKVLAKELDVPVILLSQLNRDVDKRADKRPVLADLRESGSIEQDADIVLFIHRPAYYDESAEKGFGEIVIAKNRNGRTGIVQFKHNSSLTRIGDYEEQSQNDQRPF